jgi:hypothetical protein
MACTLIYPLHSIARLYLNALVEAVGPGWVLPVGTLEDAEPFYGGTWLDGIVGRQGMRPRMEF